MAGGSGGKGGPDTAMGEGTETQIPSSTAATVALLSLVPGRGHQEPSQGTPGALPWGDLQERAQWAAPWELPSLSPTTRSYPVHIWFLNTTCWAQGFLGKLAKLALELLTVALILCKFQCSTKEEGKLWFSIRRHHATPQGPIHHHPKALSTPHFSQC